MKYFIDTEFHEHKKKPLFAKPIDTIELISIGIVTEDGKEYYAICNEFDVESAWKNEWLKDNVLKTIWLEMNQQMSSYHKTHHYKTTDKFCLKHLKRLLKWIGKSSNQISEEIKKFVYHTNDNIHPDTVLNFKEMIKLYPIHFYGYYADYDWVVFCWLFGRMIDLPKGFPMYCKDLKQIMDEKGLSKDWKQDNCPDPQGEHNALVDAKWNLKFFNQIMKNHLSAFK